MKDYRLYMYMGSERERKGKREIAMYNGKRFFQYENEKSVPLKIQKIFYRLNMISIMLI